MFSSLTVLPVLKVLRGLRYGRVLKPSAVLDHLQHSTTSFYVVNAAHLKEWGRGQLVFSKLVLSNPGAREVEDQFPWPPLEDWAARMHRQKLMREQLLQSLKTAPLKTQQIVLKDTWLPQNVLAQVPRTELSKFPEFWEAIKHNRVIVVSERLKRTMFDSQEGIEEAKRLIRDEELRTSVSQQILEQVLADLDAQEPEFKVTTERGIFDMKRLRDQPAIDAINKFIGA
jgi:hypothetical protein